MERAAAVRTAAVVLAVVTGAAGIYAIGNAQRQRDRRALTRFERAAGAIHDRLARAPLTAATLDETARALQALETPTFLRGARGALERAVGYGRSVLEEPDDPVWREALDRSLREYREAIEQARARLGVPTDRGSAARTSGPCSASGPRGCT